MLMPTEVNDTEAFVKLAEKAENCRVKRLKDVVKLKLKTQRLYTIKLDREKAEGLIKRLECQIIEV